MKPTPRLALLILSLGILSACSTETRVAPVIDRPAPTASSFRPRPQPAPAVEEAKPDARGTYTVRRGDTLLRIALDHGQNYRDLVAWNNLADPDDIKDGQVLKVAQPERSANGVVTSPVTMPGAEKVPAVPKKTEPSGAKKPYSEANLAKEDNPKAEKVVTTGVTPGTTVTANDDEKLSWMWPSDGKIIATFDEGKNKGIDIAGKMGQQVMAAGSGKVMYAGSGIRGYGNLVIVKHSNSLLSAYAHNRTILVKEGQNVTKGQPIAEMGDSDADGVKLHFEIRQQGKPVDPAKFLPSR